MKVFNIALLLLISFQSLAGEYHCDLSKINILDESKNNDPISQKCLGSMYEKGFKVKQDKKKAEEWYLKSANSGDDDAMSLLGSLYMDMKENEKALYWLKKSSNNGNTSSEFQIASYYIANNDKKNALYWLNKSSNGGDAEAQYILAKMLYNGVYIEKNESKAVNLIKMSSDQGNPYAQLFLGNLYKEGGILGKSYTKAMGYFNLACKGGLEDACDSKASFNIFNPLNDYPEDYTTLDMNKKKEVAEVKTFNVNISGCDIKKKMMRIDKVKMSDGDRYQEEILFVNMENKKITIPTNFSRLPNSSRSFVNDIYSINDWVMVVYSLCGSGGYPSMISISKHYKEKNESFFDNIKKIIK